METLGERVRKRRKELGWSQEKLAEEAGVKKRTIQDIERDLINEPTHMTLGKLARALQVSYYYLLPDALLEFLSENPEDLAFRELCQDINTKEKIDTIKNIIRSTSIFHTPK